MPQKRHLCLFHICNPCPCQLHKQAMPPADLSVSVRQSADIPASIPRRM